MQTKVIYTIYMALCVVTGKSYIGFTNNFKKRKYNHIRSAINGYNSSPLFYDAIREFGVDSIKWTILYQSPTKETTYKIMEPFYIALYNTNSILENSNGYNSSSGGEGSYKRTKQRNINYGTLN